MFVTMYDAPGVGLAAPQVGVQKRFFVYDTGDDPKVLINPQITGSDGEWYFEEGCLSIPGQHFEICRPKQIEVSGVDLDGNEVSFEADEFLARVIQHELDHLDGILMLEHLDEEQLKEAKRGIREYQLAQAEEPRGTRRRLPAAVTRLPAPPPEPRRLVYLGTPALAVAPLRALHAAGYDIPLVVSAPDRRRGRGGATMPSPVKAAALELGLDVTADPDDVLDVDADLGVVVAYGRLIKPHLLEALPFVNLHFSLLPRWRGAAPVERAILAGDDVTGVCLMAVEEDLDTGGVYASTRDAGRRQVARVAARRARRRRHRRSSSTRCARVRRAPAAGGRADLRRQDRPGRAPHRLATGRRRRAPDDPDRRRLDDVPRRSGSSCAPRADGGAVAGLPGELVGLDVACGDGLRDRPGRGAARGEAADAGGRLAQRRATGRRRTVRVT